MKRPRLGWLLASTALALAGCKSKESSSGGSEKAGTTAPSATPSAAPTPSAEAPAALLSSLMGFEGEIDMTAKGADPAKPTQPVNMLVRGDKMRLDVIPGTDAANTLGGKAYMIVRPADKKLDVITEARKQVVELDLGNPELMKSLQRVTPSSGNRPAKPDPPPKVTKTGTKETVAGYPCEDWEVTSAKDNKKRASLCVASLQSSFFHIPLTGVPGEYAFALELVDGQHFPLRVIGYDEHTNAESGRLEVTKLDPHPIEAAKFEIPAGYQTVDMLQMLQNLSAPGHVPGMPSGMPNVPTGPHHRPHR